METTESQGALRSRLRQWGYQRRRLEHGRDELVRNALEAGIIKEEIHALTGLGRTTIDRITERRE
jgi:hypothetical protein